MRLTVDKDNIELKLILEILLKEDTSISAREVARRHSTLKNASAFTRSPVRCTLIGEYARRQVDARAVRAPAGASDDNLARLSQTTHRLEELEQQVKALVSGYVGVIRAVQATGGMRSLERFWSEYKEVADQLNSVGALPTGATVTVLPGRPRLS